MSGLTPIITFIGVSQNMDIDNQGCFESKNVKKHCIRIYCIQTNNKLFYFKVRTIVKNVDFWYIELKGKYLQSRFKMFLGPLLRSKTWPLIEF